MGCVSWRRPLLVLAIGGLLLQALPAAATPVLRVGLVEGARPCSWREAGVWRGLAVELWVRIAGQAQFPYVLQSWPSTAALLEAAERGQVDVAVGCINVSPDRLSRITFSLPFQEDGLAVMVASSRFDLGRAFLSSLFGPLLLQLLGGYLLVIAALGLLLWKLETYRDHPDTVAHGRRRSFSKLFQILATGPGSNTISTTSRGQAIVIVAYLVRIVSSSLLVGYLTVNVVRETQGKTMGHLRSITDLQGQRVAVRPGSVSEALLQDLNARATAAPVVIRRVFSLDVALERLERNQLDAVLADNLQLMDLVLRRPRGRLVPSLVLQGIHPESQAFAFGPDLPAASAERIDLAISTLKRSGVVSELREQMGLSDRSEP